MKRIMIVIASVLFLLAGCTIKSTGADNSQTFEKYVKHAEKLVKKKEYPAAVKAYDQALKVDTKQAKQPIEDNKAGVNLLITVNKLMDDKNYKKVIERLGSSDLRKSKEVNVHKELEEVYQNARKQQQAQWESAESQSEESTDTSKAAQSTSLWNADKAQALEGFMAQWGSAMGQQYENYSEGTTGDFYGMSIPDRVVERAAIDGKQANLSLEKEVTSQQGRHLVAVYSDAAHGEYLKKHLYLFVIDQGQPKVYVTMQNQGNSENLLYFKETDNQDIKKGFAAIVANTKGYQGMSQAKPAAKQVDPKQVNQAFLNWAVQRGEMGGMAVSSRYFTHGAAGLGDWYAQTIDGDVQMQDNGHPGAAAFTIHIIGGCVFYTSLDGTVGLDQKAEKGSIADGYYINLDRSQPVHVYLLGDNAQVYEYIYTPNNEQAGSLFGELNDDGTKGALAPNKTFAISNDNDARAKLKELLGQ